ncbi:DUF3592 domain-containing protein [Promicromonospora sp. NPDC059942]|uniref:DUF3592 domain-containing protein n=1 Tax=Promicromonospora sp. NPDC059942 TaxID=3347009 RepID=UPI003654F78F
MIDLTGLRRASTRGLVGAVVLIVLGTAIPAYLTYDHLRERQILADRGIRVEAQVTEVDHMRRSADTVDVRPVDPPYFEAVLDPGQGLSVGDRVDVIVDPLAPGRIAVVDQPLITSSDLVFVAIDLACVLALLGLFLPLGELVRRGWARYRGVPVPAGRSPEAVPFSTPRRRLLAGMEPPQILLLLVVAPVAGAVITGLIAADATKTADALKTSGVTTQAIVEKSAWAADDGGWLDVSFRLADGTEAGADVHAQGRVHYEGESVDIVYAQTAPRIARLADHEALPTDTWLPVGLFAAFAATTVVTVPVAVVALFRRPRLDRLARLAPRGRD